MKILTWSTGAEVEALLGKSVKLSEQGIKRFGNVLSQYKGIVSDGDSHGHWLLVDWEHESLYCESGDLFDAELEEVCLPLDQIAVLPTTPEEFRAVAQRFMEHGYEWQCGLGDGKNIKQLGPKLAIMINGPDYPVLAQIGKLSQGPDYHGRPVLSAAAFLSQYPAPEKKKEETEHFGPFKVGDWIRSKNYHDIFGQVITRAEFDAYCTTRGSLDLAHLEETEHKTCVPFRSETHYEFNPVEFMELVSTPKAVKPTPEAVKPVLKSVPLVQPPAQTLTDSQIRDLTDELDSKRKKMSRREFIEDLVRGGYTRPKQKHPWFGDGPFPTKE